MPETEAQGLRKILPYTTVLLILALLYVAYTFYNRHEADAKAQAQLDAREKATRQRTLDAVFGDGDINFISFSIDTRVLKRGETAHLCFGVANATKVTMDPPVEQLRPTYRHCMDIAPKSTTKYTITASDDKGHSKSESLELEVR